MINLLGTNSYRRIIDDHAIWMNRLAEVNPEALSASELLRMFRQDFNELADVHGPMQQKTARARPVADN